MRNRTWWQQPIFALKERYVVMEKKDREVRTITREPRPTAAPASEPRSRLKQAQPLTCKDLDTAGIEQRQQRKTTAPNVQHCLAGTHTVPALSAVSHPGPDRTVRRWALKTF